MTEKAGNSATIFGEHRIYDSAVAKHSALRQDDFRPLAAGAAFAGGQAPMENPNLYGYVEGMPTEATDPNGTAIPVMIIVAAVAAGIGVAEAYVVYVNEKAEKDLLARLSG